MKNFYYAMMITIFTYTFFGFCYPEYVLLPDLYEYIGEEETAKEKDAVRDFYKILKAESGEIVIKSRFLEALSEEIDMEGKQACQTKKTIQKKQPLECSTQVWVDLQ